jgi:hypothetical protein
MLSPAQFPAVSEKPLAERRSSAPRRRDDDIDDLEFSDYGRSPRFVSGWWIVPGLLLGIAVLVFFVAG